MNFPPFGSSALGNDTVGGFVSKLYIKKIKKINFYNKGVLKVFVPYLC